MRVAIAGAGIAGLTSAIALAARGFEVDVYERAPELHETGAGIQLAPNAMAVLERLGITADLTSRLFEPDALAVRDATTAALLTKIPFGKEARRRYGAPYCTLHRADLQAGLLAAARREPRITLTLNAGIGAVAARDDGVDFSAAGTARHADILVAADGVNSSIRSEVFRHSRATSLGRTAWRAVLAMSSVPDFISRAEIGLWLGPQWHLVHYPISGGESLNLVVIAREDCASPPLPRISGSLKAFVSGVGEWSSSALVAVDASASWVQGRVALIGDAAHAMAPSAAQGGAQAIEDAWVLAATLASQARIPMAALQRYASLRRPRVDRVAREAFQNMNRYEADGVPALLRNVMLKSLPASLMLARLTWLFAWKPQ